MAKFIDKKEQVYDLKLTSYGNYLFSVGKFKPVYYTFLDDNVIYDKRYAMARRAHATYTHYTSDISDVGGYELTLKDATGTSHTFIFRQYWPAWPATGEADTTNSSRTTIQLYGLTDTHQITKQVAKAINTANAKGLIGITAGSASVIWKDEDETEISASAHIPLGLTMVLTGTQGNTALGGGSGSTSDAIKTYLSMSVFAGGFNPVIEPQNEVYNRIKNETQYLESFVLFRDIESGSGGTVQDFIGEAGGRAESATGVTDVELRPYSYYTYLANAYFEGDVTPTMIYPAPDVFKFNGIIGDAHLDGTAQAVPAWKIVALQGKIASSSIEDDRNATKIPQINIVLNYTLDIENSSFNYNPTTLRSTVDSTSPFVDGSILSLKSDDVMMFVEEVNTDVLTENFNIEVFKVIASSDSSVYDTLERKYFRKASNQIINGFMRSPTDSQIFDSSENTDTDSVEYYFDILTDAAVNRELACKGVEDFNKSSYYIDIDIDCDSTLDDDTTYYDIYGTAMEPEICQH